VLQLRQRSIHVALAKSKPPQRPERLGSRLERLRVYDPTIGATIRMPEPNLRRRTIDNELPAMDRAVVGTAEGDQVFGTVGAAFGAEVEVVDVDEDGVAAAGDAAAAVVAGEDGSAQRGWGGLFGAGEHRVRLGRAGGLGALYGVAQETRGGENSRMFGHVARTPIAPGPSKASRGLVSCSVGRRCTSGRKSRYERQCRADDASPEVG
jgi:hypothetical protein